MCKSEGVCGIVVESVLAVVESVMPRYGLKRARFCTA